MSAEQEYLSIYTTKLNDTPTNFDKTEVDRVKWVDIKKLPEFIKKEKVAPAAINTLKTIGYIK